MLLRFNMFLTDSNYTAHFTDPGSTHKLIGTFIHIWILITKQCYQYSLVPLVNIVPFDSDYIVPFCSVMSGKCHRRADVSLHGTLSLHGIYDQVHTSLFGAVYLNSGVCILLQSDSPANILYLVINPSGVRSICYNATSNNPSATGLQPRNTGLRPTNTFWANSNPKNNFGRSSFLIGLTQTAEASY